MDTFKGLTDQEIDEAPENYESGYQRNYNHELLLEWHTVIFLTLEVVDIDQPGSQKYPEGTHDRGCEKSGTEVLGVAHSKDSDSVRLRLRGEHHQMDENYHPKRVVHDDILKLFKALVVHKNPLKLLSEDVFTESKPKWLPDHFYRNQYFHRHPKIFQYKT